MERMLQEKTEAELISPCSLRWYLDFKPEGPRRGVEAVRVEDEIFSAQVELRRPVAEGPGGEAGSVVWHQVQGHVTGACRNRTDDWYI